MPNISAEIIERIANYKSNKEIIVPSLNNNIQPLRGIYTKACNSQIEKLIAPGKLEQGKKNPSANMKKLLRIIPHDVIAMDGAAYSNAFFNTNESYCDFLKNFPLI